MLRKMLIKKIIRYRNSTTIFSIPVQHNPVEAYLGQGPQIDKP